MWATEGGCTWKFVCTTACENDFKRVFTLYALANCSLRLMWFVVDVEASAYSAGHVFSWIGRARRQTSLSKETNKCHTHRNWSCMLSLLATLTSSKTIYVCNDSLMARGWGNNSSSSLVPPNLPKLCICICPKLFLYVDVHTWNSTTKWLVVTMALFVTLISQNNSNC